MMLASGSPDEAGSSGEEPSSASLTRYEARQARSAELKNRRRITKALAAKRSRAQHGQYVSQLTEEAETLRGRIRELKRQRDPDSVAHAMLSEMTAAIPAAQAETLHAALGGNQRIPFQEVWRTKSDAQLPPEFLPVKTH